MNSLDINLDYDAVPTRLMTSLNQKVYMDCQEEIRILREQTTALQWALAATLGSCHSIGEKSQVNDMTLEKIKALRKAVQNLSVEQMQMIASSEQ